MQINYVKCVSGVCLGTFQSLKYVLLNKRSKPPLHLWALPGGKLEEGETNEEGLI